MNTYKVYYIADDIKDDYMMVACESESKAERFTMECLFEMGYSKVTIKKVKHIE